MQMHGGKALVKVFERAGVDYVFSSHGRRFGRLLPKPQGAATSISNTSTAGTKLQRSHSRRATQKLPASRRQSCFTPLPAL